MDSKKDKENCTRRTKRYIKEALKTINLMA